VSAFMDATCPRCGRRFGWTGKAMDRPPCPKCGHVMARELLKKTDELMEEFEKKLARRNKEKSGEAEDINKPAE
jgi:PHP family Zn ribbon phosphoesterase